MKKIFIAGHKGMVGSAIFRKLKNNTNKIVTADKKKLNLLNQKSVLSFFKRNKLFTALLREKSLETLTFGLTVCIALFIFILVRPKARLKRSQDK